MTTHLLLLVQLVASAAMGAIAWFVQEVHYPLFDRVPDAPGTTGAAPEAFRPTAAGYHAENVRRTRPVVLVPMILEAAISAWLVAFPPPSVGRPMALLGLALVATASLSTALVQMPLHARLREGQADATTIAALVRSTRVRTVVWSMRTLLAGWMLHAFASTPA